VRRVWAARIESASLLRALVPIVALAFAIRTVYALAFAPDIAGLGDDLFYRLTAEQLAAGHGYVDVLGAWAGRGLEPTAAHPPLYPFGLAGLDLVGADAVGALRMLGVVSGTATVLVVGAIADRVAGRRAALVAAGVAAIYPSFVAADGALMSESLFGLLVAGAMLQALRQRDRPSALGAVLLGVLIGAAALTRSEALLLVPLLGWTVLLPPARGRRLALAALLLVATALTLAPWVVRNQIEFGQPVLSTNEGTTLAGANCDAAYFGSEIGDFVVTCLGPAPPGADEAARSDHYRDAALDYVGQHQKRALLVAGVRVLRVWGFYDFDDNRHLEGRPQGLQTAALVAFYPLLLAALAGGWMLFRRGRRVQLAIMASPLLVSTITAAATYGLGRLRHIVEISLIVIAATGLSGREVGASTVAGTRLRESARVGAGRS
jgi:4-amino-4-deoxy-L-arabinose transferase-like glycosyltransferase